MSTLMVEPLRPALAVSVLMHVAVLGLAMLLTVRHVRPTSLVEGGASLRGDTYDVDEILESQKARGAAAPAQPAVAEPAPAGDEEAAAPVHKRALPKKRTPPEPGAEAKAEKPEPTGGGSGEARPVAAAAASPSAGGSSEAAGSPSAGTSGADPGVANLAKAFAKAVAAATHRDPTWEALPLGSAGVVRVAIHVDDDGHIERSLVAERDETPAHLVRLVDKTLVFLRAGRFALSKSEAKAGLETLRIEVTLSQVDAQEDYEDPRHTVAMGFEPPRPSQPGRAYFVHAAGRRFDAKISIE